MSTHRTHWNTPTRALSTILIAGQLLIGLPPVEAATPQAPPPAKQERLAEPPPVNVNRTVPNVTPPPATPRFSANPTDLEISEARVFEEPILRVGGERRDPENRALATALTAYLNSGGGERTAPLQEFLAAHPGTGWRASLLLNLGLAYRRTGYFSRALNAWEEVWLLSKDASDPAGRAVADRGVGELAELNARLGRYDRLDTLFAEIEGRDVRGSAAEKVSAARQGRALMEIRPEDSFRCGPMALDRILAYGRADYRRDDRLTNSKSTLKGMSLAQVRDLARALGLDMQMAFRPPTAEPVFPAVIHWKAGHFAALIQKEGDRYLIQDPTFGDDMWVTRTALDEEGSGYLIVPVGRPLPGWRGVTDREGEGVWGKGTTEGPEQSATGPAEHTIPETCRKPPNPNMAGYAVNTMTVNLMISDTPILYSPKRGPAINFTVWHNQRDAYQPQVFTYANLGPKWTFDWLSYIEDDPAVPAANVNLYRRGSGRETYSGFNSGTQEYAPHYASRAVVVRIATTPIQYERRLSDGSKEIFAQPDGSSSFPRKVFLTAFEDPAGNRVTLTFDASLRIVAATDAIGQVTTISYDLPSDTRKITKVTDPFGRFATFEYAADGRLQRIIDRIGITSEFTYAGQDRIDTLTTPYGTTKFAFGDAGRDRWVEITDPLGGRERIEYRDRAPIPASEPIPAGFPPGITHLDYRNTFYWDKRAMALAPGDFTKATIFHWLHGGPNFNQTAGVLESEKKPLEGRVWYAYPNQPNTGAIGSMASAIKVARILDDGTTQLYQYEYNSKGLTTRVIDPLGRESLYEYDIDEIDPLRIKQRNGGSYDLLEERTYNAQHQLLTITDAAGQVTTNTHNSQGQVLTVVTPPRAGLSQAQRTTTYVYDANGSLQSVTGPLAGATTGYTYDGYGRIRTVTDSDGYTLVYDYDALDRTTKVTYPDSTYEQSVYERLDPHKQRDRLGSWTETLHDSLRRIVATRDPLGRTTTHQWCTCGGLDKLVDPKGNTTAWDRDIQGRVTKETRADGSSWEVTYETTTSRIRKVKDANGQETQYAYFLDDKVQQLSYPNAQIATSSVIYTYDATYGRKATMADGTGTTSYNYHPVGVLGAARLASVDGPLTNDTITLGYEELGRVATRTLNGSTTTWSYDALGRLTTLGDPLGSFTHTYAGATDRLTAQTYPNGQSTSYAYLPNSGDNRLQEIHHRVSVGGATVSKFSYVYDAAGIITQWTQQYETAAANVYDFRYDAAKQLISAVYRTTDSTPVVLKRYGYAYDPAANRTMEQSDDAPMQSSFNNRNRLTSQQPGGALLFKGSINEPAAVTVAGTSAIVDAANRFGGTAPVTSGTASIVVAATDPSGNVRTNTYQVTISGSSKSFAYDTNGGLTAEGTTTYEWDGANRLVRVLTGGNEVVRFVYDGEGKRSQKIAGGVTHTYVHDGEDVLEERLSTGTTIRYVHGFGIDWPLAKVQGGAPTYYLADHLGSIVQETNASGTVTLIRQYDPWGNLLQGSAAEGYAFTGREWDPESSLHYYRARYYDSKTGRFASEDPAGFEDGPNLYRYAANNPVNYVDPTGLKCIPAYTSWWIGPLSLLHRFTNFQNSVFFNTLAYDAVCGSPDQVPVFTHLTPGPGTSPTLYAQLNPSLVEALEFAPNYTRFVVSIQTRVAWRQPSWRFKADVLLCYECLPCVCPIP